MRRRKLLVCFLVLLMLVSSVAVLASCKKDPPPPPEPPTVDSVTKAISDALLATYGFKAGEELSWDFALDFAVGEDEYAIATKGNVSRTAADKNEFVVDINKNEKNIFKASADDDFLYFDFGTEKYRYVDFDFAEMMASADRDASKDIDYILPIIDILFSTVFETGTVNGNDYTVSGNLPKALNSIMALVSGAGVDIPLASEIISLIPSDTTITMTVTIDGGLCKGMKMDVTSGDTKFAMNMSKTNMNKTLLDITTPAKDDAAYTECQMLNYTIQGTFEMIEKTGRVSENVTTMGYELRMDINPFDVLRNGLFSDKNDSMLHFRVFHTCTQDCHDFCDTKFAKSKGAVIDLAYDNRNFNNKINLAINTEYLLPKSIKSLLGGIDITTMLPEYLGTNINPEVIAILLESMTAPVSSVENNFGLGFNPINLVRQILSIGSSLELNDNTFGISIDALIDLLGSVENMGITPIVEMFLEGINNVRVNIDSVTHGDKSNETYDTYAQYMLVDESIGELKNFSYNKPTSNEPYYVSKEIVSFDKDLDGNIKFPEGDGDSYYNAEGKLLPVSVAEVKDMLSSAVNMKYVDMYGVMREAVVPIVDVKGIDYTKFGVEQNVKLVLALTDGQSLGHLLKLLNAVGGMIGLNIPNIPGDVIETKITITDTKSVEFSQKDDVGNKFDSNKEYKYNEGLNCAFDVKVVYDVKDGDGNYYEKTVIGVKPTNVSSWFTNHGTPSNGRIVGYDDFEMVFNAFGVEKKMIVKMVDSAPKGYLGLNAKNTVTLNSWFTTNRVAVEYVSGKDEAGKDILSKVEEWIRKNNRAIIDEQPNMKVTYDDAGKVSLMFTKPGTYMVTGTYQGAKIATEFTVPQSSQSVPNYLATGGVLDKDTLAVTFTRPVNQYGNGLKVAFDVSVLKDNAMVVLKEDQYAVFTKDYKGDEVALEKTPTLAKILPNGYTVYIKITDPSLAFAKLGDVVAKVSVRAVDFDNFAFAKDLDCLGNIYRNVTLEMAGAMESLTYGGGAKTHNTVKFISAAISGDLYPGVELGIIVYVKVFAFTPSVGYHWTVLNDTQYQLGVVVELPPMFGGGFQVASITLAELFNPATGADKRVVFNNLPEGVSEGNEFKVQLVDKNDNNKVIYEFVNK